MAHRARQGQAPPSPPPAFAADTLQAAVSLGEEVATEILKDLQDNVRDLLRVLPDCDGEEPLRRIAQMQEQLEGLTAVAVGRARHQRVAWNKISPILGISGDTARHRYTDRYILRRIARFTRVKRLPESLPSLFTFPSPTPPDDKASPPGSPEPTGSAGSPTEEITDAPHSESNGAAYNRLAPILSMLIRTSKCSNKEVSSRIGCSPSYLSRILSGERVPTWPMTRKFALVCGADPAVLRTVWESQKLSKKSRTATVVDTGTIPMPATVRLRTAVETLHLKAGSPAPQDLSVASRWRLSITEIASLLEGEVLPDEGVLIVFVRLLGGDAAYFTELLSAARRETGTPVSPGEAPHPADEAQSPACTVSEAPAGNMIDEVLTAFSPVFAAQDTVQDGRARIRRKIAEKQQDEPQPALPPHTLSSMRARAAGLARRAPRPTWA